MVEFNKTVCDKLYKLLKNCAAAKKYVENEGDLVYNIYGKSFKRTE